MEYKDMKNGFRYSFKSAKGVKLVGTYELESGNFFTGGRETFHDHKYYYEVSACSHIEELKENRSEL